MEECEICDQRRVVQNLRYRRREMKERVKLPVVVTTNPLGRTGSDSV